MVITSLPFLTLFGPKKLLRWGDGSLKISKNNKNGKGILLEVPLYILSKTPFSVTLRHDEHHSF